jgi:hypothetical protein
MMTKIASSVRKDLKVHRVHKAHRVLQASRGQEVLRAFKV